MPPTPRRIAYLLQMADLTSGNGIAKKIRQQAGAWQRAGSAVRVFSLAPETKLWAGFDGIETEIVLRGGSLARLWRSHELCRRILAWRPEVIYFRCAYHSPGLPALFRRVPTVAEINSDDTTEYALTLSPAKQLYHRLTRTSLLRAVAGFVPVTHELATRFAPFGKPAAVIGNSIDFAEFPALPAPDPALRRLVFVGSAGSPWHGLERIGELAELFPDIPIDVVGCTVSDWQAAQGAPPERPVPANLVFHGFLDHARYEPLLRNATAALGTFGLYRKRMEEACPLKVREYLALGLPVIGACRDTDIPENADYYLRLPNAAAPLQPHAAAIAAFLSRWAGRRVPRTSVAHLDLGVKEPLRLAFMEQIAAGFRRPTS